MRMNLEGLFTYNNAKGIIQRIKLTCAGHLTGKENEIYFKAVLDKFMLLCSIN